MFKSLLGIAPQQEPDGSFRPSKLALKLATSDVTDYQTVEYPLITGERSTVLVIFTEQKNMTMQNGKLFSTGNHPVEALLPMLHLKNAGFDFEIITPTGLPVVFEMWAMPTKDSNVMELYEALKPRFESPKALNEIMNELDDQTMTTAAIFIPGGHGVMLGIPEDIHLGRVLRWAQVKDVFIITLCHGPGALLATTLEGQDFLYAGYKMAVFPDSVDKQTPMIGYLPGHMPWRLAERLEALDVEIINTKADDTCYVDRKLITGASPNAANQLGKLSAKTLLQHLSPK